MTTEQKPAAPGGGKGFNWAALAEVVACPWCVGRPEPPPAGMLKGALLPEGPAENPTGLRCRQCGRLYKMLPDGIPNLLLEEAEPPPTGAAEKKP